MENIKKKIFAICGSTRSKSSNEAILHSIADMYRESLELTICTTLDELPHFNPDLKDEEISPGVKKFRQSVNDAEGVIICTPEYVFSLPGVLKNAIEWTVSTTVFLQKPVALITAAASGEKASDSLTLIMRTIEAIVADDAILIIKGVKGKFNSEGVLTDETTKTQLKITMESFIKTLNRKEEENL